VPVADIHALDAWKITRCSPQIVIAVVDSGVSRIADLRNKLVRGTSFVPQRKATRDDAGHGTAVASVAAASTNNQKGMAGVCPLGRIMPVKIAQEGTASAARRMTAQGIRWAVDHGARIINLSLIFKKDYPGMRQAVEYAYAHNVMVVAASGNNGHLSHTYPQSYPHVLVAGGSTRRDERWDASSYGPKELVLAPSQDVLAWFGEWGLDNGNGTSLAAPEVAGLAALILSIRPDLTVDQVISAIEQGTDPVQGQSGYDLEDGYGRINCYRSLLIAQGMPQSSFALTETWRADILAVPPPLISRYEVIARAFR
jgi:thermitase